MEIKDFGHLMLDIETLSTGSMSAILSIGAVEFNIETGETGREFYAKIDLQSCLDFNLKVKASTFYWWLQQSEESRIDISKNCEHISIVLLRFNEFIKSLGDIQIWGNSARFDIGIIEDAYNVCGYSKMPWLYGNERDVRTLVSFAPNIKEQLTFTGIKHNPIDDCKHQIKYCSKIWNKLRF